MKTTIYRVLILMMFSSVIIAQDTLDKKPVFILKTNLTLVVASLLSTGRSGSLLAELGIKKRHSFQLIAARRANVSASHKFIAGDVIPTYKYFLKKRKAYAGFYSGFYLRAHQRYVVSDLRTHTTRSYLEYIQRRLGGGMVVGYQSYSKKRVVLDLLLGIGWARTVNKRVINAFNTPYPTQSADNFDGLLGLNIGYKFR
ncbi:MAG: DUF3575 domain-containing protein [Bacteroidota bacterium]